MVATGVIEDSARRILGLDVGDGEDETFWRVQLVISDQHAGLSSDP